MSFHEILTVTIKNEKSLLKKVRQYMGRFPQMKILWRKSHNTTQFFERIKNEEGCFKDRYIKRSESAFLHKALQRKYYEKADDVLVKRVECLEQAQRLLENNELEKVFLKFPPKAQQYIDPIVPTFDQLSEEWQKEDTLHPRDTRHQELTQKGDYVISKSEKIIADRLYQLGIPYHYEKPMRVGRTEVLPDFTVLSRRDKKTYIWEHFGMMDSDTYQESYVYKKNNYTKFGVFEGEMLLTSCESKSMPLDVEAIERIIKKYLI